MTPRPLALVAFTVLVALSATRGVAIQIAAIVEEVRVHGNHSTPDEAVLRIAGLEVGQRLEADTIDAARRRLERSGRFSWVEIRQRSRSIADPARIALIVLVAEHAAVRPVDIGVPTVPGPFGRLRRQTMFLPIVSVDDGYGLTYGIRTSFVGGRQSAMRVSVPATWGGTRQLALEAERTLGHGKPAGQGRIGDRAARARRPVTRLRGSGGAWRQEHPHFERAQLRQYAQGELSYRPWPAVGVGGVANLSAVHFGDVDDRMTTASLYAELDTRRDPLYPRNAFYARSTLSRVAFEQPGRSGVPAGARTRWRHDVRGYAGIVGQVVVAARLQLDTADGRLPAYTQPMLGGADTLRGVRAGLAVGDNLWASSVEARLPLTSVLRTTRLGVLAFFDTGGVWNHGDGWRDGKRERGVGAGVFLVHPVFQLQLSVARGLDRSTRLHASTGVSF